jgi:hypothetical protein
MVEYKRSCEDEIDWVEIDQLHEATLKISQNCFEFKKLCVGLIGASMVVLGKLTANSLDHSYFVVPLLICFGFWVADFTAYYYQRVTRRNMNLRIKSIAKRNNDVVLNNDIKVSWVSSAFNWSMSLYLVLSVLALLGWFLFINKVIS